MKRGGFPRRLIARSVRSMPIRDYVDAMFNMALFLQRLGEHAEAATWWRRYLEHDRTSSWAERAKRALKYCEMQMASMGSTAAEPAAAAKQRGDLDPRSGAHHA